MADKVYSWDRESFKKLKSGYDKAVKEGAETFVLEVHGKRAELLVRYAKFLIQFLEPTYGGE